MDDFEYHLRVYLDRSELWSDPENPEIFREGQVSKEAKLRHKKISDALKEGFFRDLILQCRETPSSLETSDIDAQSRADLESIANSMTSETGRALVHILILQLVVKILAPAQNIRLHKANSQSTKFGWVDGITMRSLDATYITPALREANLTKVNKDGAFMTRSFAENYPYSRVYKAGILGARSEWLRLVDQIQNDEFDPKQALCVVLFRLINLADDFEHLAETTLATLEKRLAASAYRDTKSVQKLLTLHMETSDYSARLMEIMMHSLIQGIDQLNGLGGASLKPITQMRSANLKHGNLGDVELISEGEIVAAWDAKYAKANLREELEEINVKFSTNAVPLTFGFVTSETPFMDASILSRINEISTAHNVDLRILSLNEWISERVDEASEIGIVNSELSSSWITSYTESLAQRRRDIAPIDEPCHEWLKALSNLL